MRESFICRSLMSSQFSLLDDPENEVNEGMDVIVDHVITGLKSCLHEYNEKAKENNSVLEKLGCNLKNLPQNLITDLKEIFNDNEVFNFCSADSKEMVLINTQHVMDSLCAEDELSEVQRLKTQLITVLNRIDHMHNNLQQKLETERNLSQYLDEKVNEKMAQQVMFRGKLEKVQGELKALQQNSEAMERPKYSLKEIESFHNELKRVKEDIALTTTKLNRYNKLSLNEKEAANQLAKLQEELVNVENEIKKKIDECN